MDLPPTAERCSLKTSEYSINSIDTSKIHNARGIDVWANNPPKPWNEKSSTLPRSEDAKTRKQGHSENVTRLFPTGHKHQQGNMLKQDSPQMQLRAQIEQEKELQRQQDLKRQQEAFEAQQMQFQA